MSELLLDERTEVKAVSVHEAPGGRQIVEQWESRYGWFLLVVVAVSMITIGACLSFAIRHDMIQ